MATETTVLDKEDTSNPFRNGISASQQAFELSEIIKESRSAANAKYNLENRNELMRGVVRGSDQLQATYQGGMGMLSSAMGDEAGARERFRKYQDEMQQSTENPATVTDFFSEDPKKGAMASAGNMGTYVAGTVGAAIPSVAESVLTGVVGAGVGAALIPVPDPADALTIPGGAIAGVLGKTAAKKAIAEMAEQYIKKGVAKEAAEQMATKAVVKSMGKKIGGGVAVQQTTGLHEGGEMWAEGMEQGFDNPINALILGQVSGISEAAFGVAPAALRMFSAKSAVREVAKKSGMAAAAGYLWDISNNTLQEGVQEGFQEYLGTLNEYINDPKKKIHTKENFMKWAESAAAGAVVGGAFGGVSAAKSAYGDLKGDNPSPTPNVGENRTGKLADMTAKIAETQTADEQAGTASEESPNEQGVITLGAKEVDTSSPDQEQSQSIPSDRAAKLQEIISKGFVSEEDATSFGIAGTNRKERLANAKAEIEQLQPQSSPEQVIADDAAEKAQYAEEIARRSAGKAQPESQPTEQVPVADATVEPTKTDAPEAAVDSAELDNPEDQQKLDDIRQRMANLEEPPSPDVWAELVFGDSSQASQAPDEATIRTQWEDSRAAFPAQKQTGDTASSPEQVPSLELDVDQDTPAPKEQAETSNTQPVEQPVSDKPVAKEWKKEDRVFVPAHTTDNGRKIPNTVGSVVKVWDDGRVTVQMDGEGGDRSRVTLKKDDLQSPDAKFNEGEKVGLPWSGEKIATVAKVLPDGKYELKVAGRSSTETGDKMVKLEQQAEPATSQPEPTVPATKQHGRKDIPKQPAVPRTMLPDEQGRPVDGKPIMPGDTFLTNTGRVTTPSPKFDGNTNRKANAGEKRSQEWIIDNAIAEAESRGDDFNARTFRSDLEDARKGKLPQASKDSATLYVFGDHIPKVPKPFLKDISKQPEAKSTDSVSGESQRDKEVKDAPQTKKGGDPNEVKAKVETKTEAQAETNADAKGVIGGKEGQAAGETPSPEPSDWEQKATALLNTVPAFKGASFELSKDKQTVKVTRPDGESTTIHFNADTKVREAADQKGRGRTVFGVYVRKTANSGRFVAGSIYLRSDANVGTINHEVIHWLQDLGIITEQEINDFGGREPMAYAYQEWAASNSKSTNKLFDRIAAFLEQIFDVNARFFKKLDERVSAPSNLTEGGMSVDELADIFANPEQAPLSKSQGVKAPKNTKPKEAKPRSVRKDHSKGIEEGLDEAKQGAALFLKGINDIKRGSSPSANLPMNADIARGLGMMANGLIKAGKHKFLEFIDEVVKLVGIENVREYAPVLELGWNKKVETDSRLDKSESVVNYLTKGKDDGRQVYTEGDRADQEGTGGSVSDEGKSSSAATSGSLEEVQSSDGKEAGATGDTGGLRGSNSGSVQQGSGTANGNVQDGDVGSTTGESGDSAAGTREEGFSRPGDGSGIDLAPKSSRPNFHLTDPNVIVGRGLKDKFARNVRALELSQELEESGRPPTQEELETLASYIGWGAFGQELFQGNWNNTKVKKDWESENEWLREHLGEEEWRSAQESIPNAHYTDPEVVSGIWSMIERLGFKGGRFLEPSFGVGNFAALMPRDIMSQTNFTAIELDKATSRIAKILYPQINVQQKGYQDSKTPNDFYDVTATNVPFGDYKIVDRMYRMPYSIHNYFFRKAIDQTKPGGLMVFVTSNMTMDGKEEAKLLRKQLSDRGDLIAAFRFPTGAFERYAKTKVVADLIIIRKRKPGEEPSPLNKEWIDIVPVDTPSGEKIDVNDYWTKHPENILGTLNHGHGTTSGRPGMIVDKPANLDALWTKAIESVPSGILNTERTASEGKERANERKLRQNTVVHQDGDLYIAKGEQLIPFKEYVNWYRSGSKEATIKKSRDEIVALLKVRDSLEKVLEVQGRGEDASQYRSELNKGYDVFVGKYGPITNSKAIGYLKASGDAIANAVASLESINANGEYEKRPVFSRTTVRQAPRVGEKLNPIDAFALARNNSVDIDWESVAKSSQMRKSDVLESLQKEGLIYKTGDESYEAADVFLSGNMSRKIRQLEAAKNEGVVGLDKSIEAAKSAMPEPLVYNQIQVSIGAPWITAEDYSQFFADLLGEDIKNTKILKAIKGWKVDFATSANRSPAVVTHGHNDVAFSKMVAAAMNNGRVTVFYKDSEGNPHKDEEATLEANAKIDELKDKFKDWIWQSPERIARLSQAYNEDHRSIATPDWKNVKVPLLFEGLALQRGDDPFSLRKHQETAVWRAIVSGKGLFAHEVGTGKTLTMASIAIESRRLRLANKPVLFAHNANSQAVYREAQEAYPGAKILYVDNLDAKNKGQAMASIATEDWDLIVIPHSLVENLKMRPETLEGLLQEQMDQLEAAALEAFNEDDSPFKGKMPTNLDNIGDDDLKKLKQRTAKELVKERLRLRERIRAAQADAANESTVFIEDMGIDMLLVDEAHIFKKIPLATRQQVKGLNKRASNIGNSLMLLSDYIRGTQNGRGIYLFTGTPITNTLNEIYNMQRFIMPDEMQAVGVKDWDGWFNTFATSETSDELSAGGTYEEFERLTSFVNLPELRASIGQYMDTVFASEMPEFIPRESKKGRVEEGDPIIGRPYKEVHNETLQMMPVQKRLSENLKRRYRALRDAKGKAKFEMMRMREYMPLVINTEGVKLALDPRLMDGVDASQIDPRDPRLKVNKMLLNAMDYYHSHPKATQMIFMEMGHDDWAKRVVGRDNDGKPITERVRVFNLAKEIKRRLMEEGVPESEIAIFSAMTKEKRAEAAKAMNRGEVRFAIGGTETLGTGINAQENLIAMHHMDAPWMPGALEQRNGRGHRQGNRWNTVHEHRYLTEGPQDGRRWQVLLTKDRFIYRFMHHKGDERIIDMSDVDMDEDGQGDFESTFSAAVGDPRIQTRFKLEREIAKLVQAKDRHHRTIQNSLWEADSQERNDIPRLRSKLESYLDIQKKYQESRPEKTDTNRSVEPVFVLSEIGDAPEKTFSGADAISDALERVVAYSTLKKGSKRKIGEYRGVDVFIGKQALGTDVLYVGNINLEIKPSFASLDGILRNLEKRIDSVKTDLGKKESFAKSAKESAKLPFVRQPQLDAKQKKLKSLVEEIESNPEGSPFWFRNMAPIGTSIYIRKRKRSGGMQSFSDMQSEMHRERMTGDSPQNVRYELEEHAVSGYRSDTHILYEDGTDTVALPSSKVLNENGEQVFADLEELRQLNDTSSNLTQAINNLPSAPPTLSPPALYQTDDVNPSIRTQALDIALAAEDAGIKTFDRLVAYSVKTVGEHRTREIARFLRLAADAAGFAGVRYTEDVLGRPNVTREQAVSLAKAAFPRLSNEQIEAGIDIVERNGLLDKIGFAPFGSPVPGQSLKQNLVKTDTPAFKKWFGNSKAVDENGNPLRLVHGTSAESGFSVFSGRAFAAFGSTDTELTNGYAGGNENSKSLPIYFKAEKPAYLELELNDTIVPEDMIRDEESKPDDWDEEDMGEWAPKSQDLFGSTGKTTEDTLADYLGLSTDEFAKMYSLALKENEGWSGYPQVWRLVNSKAFRNFLEKGGYDSFTALEGGSEVWAVINASQVKSAIGNRGTFDPSNPDSLLQNQEQGGNVKGWTEFISATRAIIGGTGGTDGIGGADFSTFVHEIFHPMRRFVLDKSVSPKDRFGITNEEIEALEDYAGVVDGNWTVNAEEKAAKAWEQYLLEGKAPPKAPQALTTLFEKLSQWMQEVYKGIQQITGRSLPSDIRKLFDKIVQRAGGDPVAEQPATTSIKNEIVNENRVGRGIPALADVASQSQQEWLDIADSMLQDDPMLGDRLVKELHREVRNLSNVEVAVMQIYYRQVNNQLERASERLFAAKDNQDPVASAQAQIDTDIIMNVLVEMEDATKKAGREWGRAGVARQIELERDFSLAALHRKARVANAGNALSESQQEEIRVLAKRIAELEDQLAKANQEKLDEERQKNVDAQIEDSKQKTAKIPDSIRSKVVDKLKAFKSKFASAFATSSGGDALYATQDEMMAEEAESVVQAYVDIGIFSYGELLANIRKDLGSDLPASVQAAFATAWQNLNDNGDIPSPMVDKNDVRGLSRLAKQIERSLVEAGITERDEVVQGVYESLQEIIPDISKRETMDAMSGYGQYSLLSKDENDRIIRDINGQLQQLAKLDDMQSGVAPSKTGVERREQSEEERRLIAQVNEAKRRGGYVVTDPDSQLKTAIAATKTALRNRIKDLQFEIDRKEKIVRTRTDTKSDPEIIELRKQRDELMKQHKALFPKPEATMDQRIAATSRVLDRVIADLEQQLQTKEFDAKKKGEPISTPELDAKRARIEALRAERDALRGVRTRTDEQIAKAYKTSLLKRLADYKERIAKSEFDPKPRKELRVLSQEEITLKKELVDTKDRFFRLAADYRLANMSPREKAWDYVKETAHLSRALMTSFDFSAVLRQGGTVAFAHPKMAAETSKEMYKAMLSEAAEFETAEKIRNDDMYQFAMTAGLSITEDDGKITKQEEAYMGRWARQGIGAQGTKLNTMSQKLLTPVAASARGYMTFLNGIRFKLFKHMIANLGRSGQVTADEAKVIAKFINAATGRSELGPMMKWAEQLNTVFFAPRFVASRFQYLGMPLWLLGSKKVSGRVKKAIAMEYIRHSAGILSFLSLAVALGSLMAGDDEEEKPTVSLDPRSSDFLKLKLGETRIDPMSGLSQAIVFMSRIRYGQMVRADGSVVDLRGENVPYGGLGMSGTIGNFLRTKLAPIPGSAMDIATGENVVGKSVTPFSSIVNLFIPLSLREIKDTATAKGIPQGSLITLLSLHGMGASTYGPKSNYTQGTAEQREKQFDRDLKKMTFDSKAPSYQNLLGKEQVSKVSDRRDDRKQALVFSASANPVRKDYKSDETYKKAVAERDSSMRNLKESGLNLDEARKLLIKHWESSYGSAKETRKGVRVYKKGLSERLRKLRIEFN